MLTLVDTLRSGDLVELRGVINANSVGGCGEGNEEGSGTHFDRVVLVLEKEVDC